MFGSHFVAIFLLAICSLGHAYPALFPYIYNTPNNLRPIKRSDSAFPQIEDDVGELDQLRSKHTNIEKRQNDDTSSTTTTKEAIEEVAVAPEANSKEDPLGVISHTNTLPDLERQLEVATPLMSTTTTTSTSATTTATFKDGERSQLEEPKTAAKPAPAPEPTAHAKAFYGAARLAFGQNPEVLPTSSTSTTTSTTTTTTPAPVEAEIDPSPSEPVVADIETADAAVAESELSALTPTSEHPSQPKQAKDQLNKETIGDILIDQLELVAKTTERRSSMPPKTAQSLLRNSNGQYSSFDMAQYVFWTGDEAGVAHAVEELITENLITRENALKFLRDIRLGIEFLQRSYANRIFPDELELRQNHLKRGGGASSTGSPTTTSTSTTTTTTTTPIPTTEKPLPLVHLESDPEAMNMAESNAAKILHNYILWNKQRQLPQENLPVDTLGFEHERDSAQDPSAVKLLDSYKQHDIDHETLQDVDLLLFGSISARGKIMRYLYNKYSLEELLYKVFKVMLARSQASGKDQEVLQEFADLVERQGNFTLIPVKTQELILRMLLPAFTDALAEHPELLAAAGLKAGNYRLPIHNPSK